MTLLKKELSFPNVLSSYFFKTIFMWTCESVPAAEWYEENIVKMVLLLIDELIQCLVQKRILNYFIPLNNMIDHMPMEIIRDVLRKLIKIRRNISQFCFRNRFVNENLLNAFKGHTFLDILRSVSDIVSAQTTGL